MSQNIAGPSPTRDQNPDRFLKSINGCPQTPCLGVISGTVATSNQTTAIPFTFNPGMLYLLQCDSACYVATGPTSAQAISNVSSSSATGGGFLVDPTAYGTGFVLLLQPSDTCVAMLPVTGTTNLKPFTMV